MLRSVLLSSGERGPPTVTLAQDWHRGLYEHIPLPVSYYAGEVRDSDPRFPELVGYEVSVGRYAGVSSAHVPDELANFQRQMHIATARIDLAIPVGAKPASPRELRGVLTACAFVHGEWVRIHPFANGNGRTARLWANWTAVRYGLPPFVNIKPRPRGGPYSQAAAASMSGDHTVAVAAFSAMLREALSS